MSVTDPVIDAIRAAAAAGAVAALVVDDLRPADLPQVAWSGSASHLDHIAEALGRVGSGEVEYLSPTAVRQARGPRTTATASPMSTKRSARCSVRRCEGSFVLALGFEQRSNSRDEGLDVDRRG